jgi:hypothetical protein
MQMIRRIPEKAKKHHPGNALFDLSGFRGYLMRGALQDRQSGGKE